jgi:hypothetical protein
MENQLLKIDELNKIIQAVDLSTSMFKTCKIFDYADVNEARLLYFLTAYLERTSVSLTDLIRTDLATEDSEQPVFLKMWFSWTSLPGTIKAERAKQMYIDNPNAKKIFGELKYFVDDIRTISNTKSLEYEAAVYQYITDNIIMKNISPNFIPILTNNKCSVQIILDSLKRLADFERKSLLVEKLELINKVFPEIPMNFIMTGSSDKIKSTKDFLQNVENGDVELWKSEYHSIMFQFFYTFYVMNEFRIVHNDNHMSNVLIQTLPKRITLDITIGTFNIKFTTKYIVKMFDWDRSYCEAIGQNTITTRLYESRTISSFIPGRDFSTFVCFLYTYNIPAFNNILDRLISGPKPTHLSNNEMYKIPNGVTPALKEWMSLNPSLVINKTDEIKYITINKHVLETLVPETTIYLLRTKLGRDRNGNVIYDGPNFTNIYLGVDFGARLNDTLIILKGFTCHPLYDSADLDVVKYFKDPNLFAALCVGLAKSPGTHIYKYSI